MSDMPPWDWSRFTAGERAQLLRELSEWVDWLGDAYAPWVLLPPCWPAHEGLRVELTMFWLWHRWMQRSNPSPVEGIKWHNELRHSAAAWRELASCRHEPPVRHHEQLQAAHRERRDHFLTTAFEGSP
ncbi:MAG TPA: hypothetical protein VF062_13230 [Candidatus Limnocylindrales bacterium]